MNAQSFEADKNDYNYDEVRLLGENYVAVRDGYKWGLIDKKSSQILMRTVYDYISTENGKLWARYQDRKFYVQQENLPLHYDCVYDFKEFAPDKHWAKVALNGKFGTIDQNFKEIVPCNYVVVMNHYGALWAGKRQMGLRFGDFDVYSYDGQRLTDYPYCESMYPVVSKNVNGTIMYGIINEQSYEVVPCKNKEIKIIDFGYSRFVDRIIVYVIVDENESSFLFTVKHGLVDVAYSTIRKRSIGCEFLFCTRKEIIQQYNQSNIVVDSNNNDQSLVIDVYSEDVNDVIVSYEKDKYDLTDFVHGSLFICQSLSTKKYGLINKQGCKQPCVYDVLLKDICIVVGRRESQYEEIQYEDLYSFPPRVKTRRELIGGLVDIFSENGNLLMPEVDYKDWNLIGYGEGYLRLIIKGKLYIYKNDHLIVPPLQYDEVGPFCSKHDIDVEYALVRNGVKWGAINSDGILLIPLVYDEIKGLFRRRSPENFCCTTLGNPEYIYLMARTKNEIFFFEANKGLKRVDNEVIEDILSYAYGDDIRKGYTIKDILNKKAEDVISDIIETKRKEAKWFRKIREIEGANCIIAYDVVTRKIGLLNSDEQKLCDFVYDNNFITPYIYDNAIIKVVKDGKDGLINKDGKLILPCSYDYISEFNEDGIAIVKKEGAEGLVLKSGEIILPCEYDYISCQDCGRGPKFTKDYLIIAIGDSFGLADKKGHIVVPCKYPRNVFFDAVQLNFLDYGYVLVKKDNCMGLVQISKPDSYLLSCIYKEIDIHKNSKYGQEPMNYIVALRDEACEILNLHTGEKIIAITDFYIEKVCFIVNNYIVARLKENDIVFYRIFSMSNEGSSIDYSNIRNLNNQYLQVSKNGQWGVFDFSKYKEIIPCRYECVDFPSCDMYRIKTEGKYGFVDGNNRCVIDCIYDEVGLFFEDIVSIRTGKYWGFINKNREIIAAGFEEVHAFSEGLAAVKKDGKWGYIDACGKIVIPLEYSYAGYFHDGLADVSYEEYYGYIDKHNNTIIPFKYKHAESYREGTARVSTNSGSGEISKDGIEVEWKYNDIYDNKYDTDYDSREETWGALTDGMYGDMPDDFDGDYSFLGY